MPLGENMGPGSMAPRLLYLDGRECLTTQVACFYFFLPDLASVWLHPGLETPGFFFHLSLIVRFGQVLPTNDSKFSSILLHPHHPPCFLPPCAHYKFVCFRMLKVNGVSISGIANKLSLLCQVWPWWQQLQKTLFGEGFWSWGLNENDGHDQLAVCAMRRRENVAACWVSSLSHYKGVSLGSATEFNIIWKQIFNSLTL